MSKSFWHGGKRIRTATGRSALLAAAVLLLLIPARAEVLASSEEQNRAWQAWERQAGDRPAGERNDWISQEAGIPGMADSPARDPEDDFTGRGETVTEAGDGGNLLSEETAEKLHETDPAAGESPVSDPSGRTGKGAELLAEEARQALSETERFPDTRQEGENLPAALQDEGFSRDDRQEGESSPDVLQEGEASMDDWQENESSSDARQEGGNSPDTLWEGESPVDVQQEMEQDSLLYPEADPLQEAADPEKIPREGEARAEEDSGLFAAAVQMCGEAPNGDGNWYYRKENCGIRVVLREGNQGVPASDLGVRFHIYFDGMDRTNECTACGGGDGTLVCTYPAELVSECFDRDGLHEIEVEAVSRSGVRLTELGQCSDEIFADPVCQGVTVSGCKASFMLDRSCPVFSVSIDAPGAVRQSASERGKRYYFNSAFSIRAELSDDNLELSSVQLRRGSLREGSYNGEEVMLEAFPEVVDGGSALLGDEVDEEGVYRYELVGWDKAGNPFISKNESDADACGRTRHIVVEKRKPAGTFVVSAGEERKCEMMRDGKWKTYSGFIRGNQADLLFSSDPSSTRLPVMISCRIEASPRLKRDKYQTSSYVYGGSLHLVLNGRQRFCVKKWTLTDLAGNSASFSMPEALSIDPEGPKLTLEAAGGKGAGAESGLPLYSGNVQFRIQAEDPGFGSGGSGVLLVSARVSANGASKSSSLYQGKERKGIGDWSGEYVVGSGEFESNDILLEVSASDAAGNTSTAQYRFAVDVTPPSVRLIYGEGEPEHEMYFNTPRTARIEVEDRNFDAAAVHFHEEERCERGEWSKWRDGEKGGIYVQELCFAQEGEYQLHFEVRDLAGNLSSEPSVSGPAPEHFVIDRTAPALSVSEDGASLKKGSYFPAGRSFELTVEEEHYADEGQVLVSCDDAAEEIPFQNGKALIRTEEEGAYRISGSIADLAGNVASVNLIPEYVIDRTPPEVWIEGVEDGSANREELFPVVRIRDANLGDGCLEVSLRRGEGEDGLEGLPPVLKDGDGYRLELLPVSEDGLYQLAAVGRDLAGNVTSQSITFSENLLGTVFECEQKELDGKWTNQAVQPSFVLHDVDEVTVVSCTINGEEQNYDYSGDHLELAETLEEDGIYQIGIETMDAAGHRNVMEPLQLKIDRTAPTLTLSGISPGKKYYFEPLELQLTSNDPEAEFTELVLDGKALAPSMCERRGSALLLPIQSFGEHTISAQLADPAGNVSERVSRSFVISSDPWLRLTSNPLILILLIAAAAGGAALLILRFRLNKNAEKSS